MEACCGSLGSLKGPMPVGVRGYLRRRGFPFAASKCQSKRALDPEARPATFAGSGEKVRNHDDDCLDRAW